MEIKYLLPLWRTTTENGLYSNIKAIEAHAIFFRLKRHTHNSTTWVIRRDPGYKVPCIRIHLNISRRYDRT